MIVRNMAEGVCLVKTSDSTIAYANPKFAKMFGYEDGELDGQPVWILNYEWATQQTQENASEIMKLIRERDSYSYEIQNVKKDGSAFWCRGTASLFNHPEYGSVFVAVQQDITERKIYEMQQSFLARTAKLLDESLDYEDRIDITVQSVVPEIADNCVLRIIEEGELKFKALATRDPAMKSLLRESVDKGAGIAGAAGAMSVASSRQPVFIEDAQRDIIDNESVDPLLRDIARTLGTRSYIIVPLIRQNIVIGTLTLSMSTSGRRFTNEDVAFAQLIANRCAVAIESARLYSVAKNAIAARENILSIVAHDLRNPIALIDLTTQLLLKQREQDEKLSMLAKGIVQASQSMQRLISDLLDFGKLESGAFRLEKRSVSIESIVEASLETLRAKALPKQIQIATAIESLPMLNCDPSRIIQVLWNLIGNAIKFSPNGSTVRLTARAHDRFALIAVSDSGPGIAPNDLPHIFKRFWQSKESAALGSGLGLTIAKDIVEAHGGKIWVESQPGHGSQFYFTVPFA